MTAVGTIANRLKAGIVDALTVAFADEEITVVDGTQRDDVPMPMIAVQVTSAEAYSAALRTVQRIKVAVTLGVHYGDDEPGMIQAWIDTLEDLLANGTDMQELATNGIRIFDWVYGGAVEVWDEEVHDTEFSISIIATRFLTSETI